MTVVSQSESVFAQETINNLVAKALGRTDEMSVEVDGISGATLTSTGVIDAINAALQAAMGNRSDAEKTYQDGTLLLWLRLTYRDSGAAYVNKLTGEVQPLVLTLS